MSVSPYFIKNSLSRLDIYNSTKKGPLLSSLHHFDVISGRTKQKRADRRLNIIKILKVMISEMDLDTFGWGQWFTRHDGTTDFYTRGVSYLSSSTGLHERTVCRALSDLEKNGYLLVNRNDGIGKCGKTIRFFSIRKLTNKLFIELGFKNKTIEDTKSWKRKKNQKSFYKNNVSNVSKSGLDKLSSLFNHFKSSKKKADSKASTSQIQKLSSTDKHSLLSRAQSIAEATGKSPMDVYRDLITSQ